MKKLAVVAAVAVAFIFAAHPVFAGWEEERALLIEQLKDAHRMLEQSLPSYTPPPLPAPPTVDIYRAPPDPTAKPLPSSKPPNVLKQRCSPIGGKEVCMLGY